MKILIFYITERSGHHSAALAIKRAMELKDPAAEVRCVNAFAYFFPVAEKIVHNLYLFVIKRVPKIWGGIYDKPKFVARSSRIKKWLHIKAQEKLERLFSDFQPDAVLCTQAFPCGIVGDYKKRHPGAFPLIAVLTDFAPHSFWVHEEVDRYIVACDESRAMLAEKGVPEKKILPLGIPIDPKFAARLDKDELLANFGLDGEVPVVMIMGGGHGLGPIKKLLIEIDEAAIKLQLIVVCGINHKLYNWIRSRPFKRRLLVFRFTDQVERLMSVSSLIVSKPGGITTAEALAKKVPMIILNPIPGQEARNTDLLVSHGAALKIDSPQEVLGAIKKVLDSPKGWSVAARMSRFSRPDASVRLAELVLAGS